jgi:hypothetical protein
MEIERLEKRARRILKIARFMQSTSRIGFGYANRVSAWIISRIEREYWLTIYERQRIEVEKCN